MKHVYQLHATGQQLLFPLHSGTLFSSTVFSTEEKAKIRIPAFRLMVVDPDRMNALADNEMLKITVVSLEIVD